MAALPELLTEPATAVAHLTSDRLADFGAWCAQPRGDRALDVESTGLDVRAPGFFVTHLALGASDGSAWVVDGRDEETLVAALRIAWRAGPWWAHNATYDATALAAVTGLRLRGLNCTLVLTRTLSPETIDSGGASLKALRPATERALERLAQRWGQVTGHDARLEERAWLTAAVTTLSFDDPALLDYVSTDAVECARLVGAWRDAAPKVQRSAAVRENKTEDLWRWVANRGYRVDTEMLRTELESLAGARRACILKHGVDLTSNSDDTRRWVLRRGIVITDLDGKPTLSHKHHSRVVVPPEAAADWSAFQEIRERSRTTSKLAELNRRTGPTGRVYPRIRGIGAHTGRMSIGGPALQNLPGPLRGLLLAEPGHVLVGCDLDRVEPRVVAALSGDQGLIEAVQHDVYTELAASVWGEGSRDSAEARKVAKTGFLAMLYGQGPRSLAASLAITEAEARDVLDGLALAYPDMAAWMRELKTEARSGRSLATAFGRPLPPTSDKPYRAVNWIVQGTAADLFKIMTIKVAEGLGRDALWLPVHDELIVQVPEGNEQPALRVMAEAMCTELNGVSIMGTPEVIGSRWAKI
jgi:DNA polymerase-1